MLDSPLAVLAVLLLSVALSEWLCRTTPLRHLGSALLVIVLAAVWANLGLIPTGSQPSVVYDAVFGDVAPVSIFLLLLGVSLADIRRAGLPMIGLFALGATGTFAGVLAGMAVVDGPEAFGELHHALGGMFVGTYVGGSLNFNLLGAHFGVTESGALYTGAVAIDSIMTTVWMVVTLVLPRGLAALSKGKRVVERARDEVAHADHDDETFGPLDAALVLGLGLAGHALSRWISAQAAARGADVPAALVLTTLALVAAQLPAVRRLRGGRALGMTGLLLFLAVIGAYCDLAALGELGRLGPVLLLFVVVVLSVHGFVTFGGALVLGADKDMAAVASQANVGGGTSALALARSLGRSDLVLPAILVGSLGTAVGTYLGFLAAGVLA